MRNSLGHLLCLERVKTAGFGTLGAPAIPALGVARDASCGGQVNRDSSCVLAAREERMEQHKLPAARTMAPSSDLVHLLTLSQTLLQIHVICPSLWGLSVFLPIWQIRKLKPFRALSRSRAAGQRQSWVQTRAVRRSRPRFPRAWGSAGRLCWGSSRQDLFPALFMRGTSGTGPLVIKTPRDRKAELKHS